MQLVTAATVCTQKTVSYLAVPKINVIIMSCVSSVVVVVVVVVERACVHVTSAQDCEA